MARIRWGYPATRWRKFIKTSNYPGKYVYGEIDMLQFRVIIINQKDTAIPLFDTLEINAKAAVDFARFTEKNN